MKVAILCGGQGSRIREGAEDRPKPLLEIGDRPILWHIMKGYAHYGFRDFVICLGHRAEAIRDYFLRYDPQWAPDEQGLRVTLADTGLDSMTGGRIKRIERHIDGDTFLATYGDGLADVDLARLVEFHKAHGKTATVTAVRPRAHFGLLETNEDGAVRRFEEKPLLDCWASAGFLVFERRIFDYLDGDDCVLEGGPLERLASEGQLMAYRHGGFFHAMDTYREYVYLNKLWNAGKAPWKVWE